MSDPEPPAGPAAAAASALNSCLFEVDAARAAAGAPGGPCGRQVSALCDLVCAAERALAALPVRPSRQPPGSTASCGHDAPAGAIARRICAFPASQLGWQARAAGAVLRD